MGTGSRGQALDPGLGQRSCPHDPCTPYPVSDSDNAYCYDQNGNTTKDLDRNILSIQYNLLNLPRRITYTDGSMATYTYNSLGEKLQVAYATSSLTASLPAAHVAESEALGNAETRNLQSGMPNVTVDYCGNLVYNGTGLSRILLGGEGYCRLANGSPLYFFFIKDHLGSTRVVVRQDGSTIQSNQYYPYGKSWDGGYWQPYLYNGKEIDMMHGLEWYDYGARMYESGICRFMTMDPLCEKYYSISPYAYCGNNPVNAVDSIGMSYDWVQNQLNKKIEWRDDVTSPNNTPKGYSYIGRSSDDILHHYGFTSKVLSQEATLWAFGREGNPSANASQFKTTKTTALLSIEAVTTIDNSAKTKSNLLGWTFSGIKINGSFTQDNITSNPNYNFLYGGSLNAEIQGTATYSNLVFRKGPSLNIPGNVTKEASIFVSQELLNRGTTIRNVRIDIGFPSTFIVLTNSFKFNIYR